jgi:RHS repeat-associated protein
MRTTETLLGQDNYFRTYDPAIERYISADPIGQNSGINVNAYVGSSPITRFDPHGLDVFFNFAKPAVWQHSWVVIGGGTSPLAGSSSQSFGAYPLDAPRAKFSGIWGGATQFFPPIRAL